MEMFDVYTALLVLNRTTTMGDVGERPGGPGCPPLFWVKKEEITVGRKAGKASKTKAPPPAPLAQGLDPPLY